MTTDWTTDDERSAEDDPLSRGAETDDGEDRVRRDRVGDDIATARLLVMSPLLAPGLSRRQRRRLAEQLAAKGWEHPLQGQQSLSLRTVWRWLQRFRESGIDGLRPQYRKDRGTMQALSPEAFAEAVALKEELRSRTVERVIELMELRGVVEPGSVARSTLQRHLQRRGLIGRRVRKEDEAVERYCAKAPGQVWHSDEKHGPYLLLDGRAVRTRIFGFLDDCSRLCCSVEAFLEGSEINLEKCFKRGIQVWRCPGLVYADNGKVYVAQQLTRICAELGIGLAHTAPYSPESNGKMERFWGTLAGFTSEANAAQYSSLEELNEALWAYVELRYNRIGHSSLAEDKTPFQVYTEGLEGIRPASDEEIERAFRHLATRKVNKDGTFSFQGVIFEAGTALAGQQIEVRYDPEEPTDVVIYRGPRRLRRARLFSPTDRLPARKRPAEKPARGVRHPVQSSRQYLASLQQRHRSMTDAASGVQDDGQGGERFTAEMLLAQLDLAEQALTTADRRALHSVFDTFGPFDAGTALQALEQAIGAWGGRRHLSVYLRAIVKACTRD